MIKTKIVLKMLTVLGPECQISNVYHVCMVCCKYSFDGFVMSEEKKQPRVHSFLNALCYIYYRAFWHIVHFKATSKTNH